MKVDRERFLLLAAALTAGACGASDAQPTVQAAIPPQPPATSEPLVVPPMASASAAPTASAAPDPPAGIPIARGAPNPYDGTPVTGQSCDPAQNKIGTVPACKISSGPGPTCESINDTKKECPTMNKLLKPKVAQAAIECMNRRSGTKDICEFNVSSICAYEALGSVCLEPSAKATCQGVVQKCGGPKDNYNKMSQESCEAGVSAIVDAKKKKFIACISESCRFETCLTYL